MGMMSQSLDVVSAYLAGADRVWLFLDYDGTLADFTGHPDRIIPDENLIVLLQKLAARPEVRVSVISGRRLAHIEKLVPRDHMILAGTYGIEIRLPSGKYLQQLALDEVRPQLEQVKAGWLDILDKKDGFIFEDKNWSLALHGLHATEQDAVEVLGQARELCEQLLDDRYRLLGGFRFFEAAPKIASKAYTVRYLLQQYPYENACLLYFGDDDKDEEAFSVVQERGGKAVAVLHNERLTNADAVVSSIIEVRAFLEYIRDNFPWAVRRPE